MKILIFTQHFWPENFRINFMAEFLSKNKIVKKLSVFTGKPNYPKGKIYRGYKKFFFEKRKKNKIQIYRSQIIPRGSASSIRLILNYLSYVFFGLINLYKVKGKYDIVFVYCTSPIFQAIPAIAYAKLNKIPLVLWVQDLWPNSVEDTGYIKNKFFLNIIKYITSIIYNNSDLILVQSEKFISSVKSLTSKNVQLFFNPSEFKYTNKKQPQFISKKVKNIFYTGNIGSAQNLENLVLFCKKTKLKNFKITLYGDGSKKKWLNKTINDLKLNDKIQVKKFLNKKTFQKEMYKADAFLILLGSGKALSRTIPAKFQTYLYFGKPIISWADGEASNIIKKNNLGFSSRSRSISQFNLCVDKIIKLKKKEYNKYYYTNTSFFNNHFSLERCVKILLNILKNQINKKK